MEPWGLHAHKFNCTAGAFYGGINEGVDGPASVCRVALGQEWEKDCAASALLPVTAQGTWQARSGTIIIRSEEIKG